MQNIPDKDFDNIFKEAADNYRPPYNPKAWTKMERKIEVADSARWTLKKAGYLAVGALLIAGSLWYTFSGSRADIGGHYEEILRRDQVNENTAAPLNQGLTENQGSDPARNHQVNPPDAEMRTSAVSSNEPREENGQIIQQETTDRRSISTLNEKTEEQNHTALAATPALPLKTAEPLKPDLSGQKENGKINTVVIEPSRETGRFNPYLSVSLSVSPDFSGLALSDYSKTGSNAGITLSYHLSRRLSLSTGFIRANKIYSGKNLEKGYGQYPGQPDIVHGDCHVIDIPLNIRYNFIAGNRHNFFLATGLSSYIMTSEKYDFIYEDHPYYNTQLSVHNEYQHFFGIYNLSAGYEFALSRRWSAMIEPFVKIPLTDIGASDLRLHSSGIFISVNYHFKTLK